MKSHSTYQLARTARGKLLVEAKRPEHRLRFLVCHANMLDSLVASISEIEDEKEGYYNQLYYGDKNRPKQSMQRQKTCKPLKTYDEDSDSDEDQDQDTSDEEDDDEDEVLHNQSNSDRERYREPELRSKTRGENSTSLGEPKKVEAAATLNSPNDNTHAVSSQKAIETFAQAAIGYMVSSVKAATSNEAGDQNPTAHTSMVRFASPIVVKVFA